ncbi:N-terminal glutamine amidase-domain-containing protein [Melanogaster broomeanus]|nr:N-terminal glutamine amidase-domain-containing protein [Melanogaster broomeanus]
MDSAFALPDCSNSIYTSCYCEENIYLLVKRFLTPPENRQKWDVFAVFISNPTRTVALWNQRMASSRDTAVVWDYHVVLVLRSRSGGHHQPPNLQQTSERSIWIYDLDTQLPVPCHWKEVRKFREDTKLSSRWQTVIFISLFRVVPGDDYLDNFASDRSHMISQSNTSEEPRYLANPPPYPLICGPLAEKAGIKHNLMTQYVSMVGTEKRFGSVMNFDSFLAWCSLTETSG